MVRARMRYCSSTECHTQNSHAAEAVTCTQSRYIWASVTLRLSTVQHAEQQQNKKQSRIRKEATQARSGEKGRVLGTARSAPPELVTEQVVQEIKSLHPADPEPPAPAQALVSNLFLPEVASSQNATTQ